MGQEEGVAENGEQVGGDWEEVDEAEEEAGINWGWEEEYSVEEIRGVGRDEEEDSAGEVYSEERGEIGAGEGERTEVERENGEESPRRQRDGR